MKERVISFPSAALRPRRRQIPTRSRQRLSRLLLLRLLRLPRELPGRGQLPERHHHAVGCRRRREARVRERPDGPRRRHRGGGGPSPAGGGGGASAAAAGIVSAPPEQRRAHPRRQPRRRREHALDAGAGAAAQLRRGHLGVQGSLEGIEPGCRCRCRCRCRCCSCR